MRIIYTKHAERRIKERLIKKSSIESCIDIPDYNVTRGEVTESYKEISSKVLKVVWVRKDSFIKVISVMWK